MLTSTVSTAGSFSLEPGIIGEIFEHAQPLGHHDVLAVLEHSHKNSYLLLHDTHLQIRELLRHAGVNRLTRRLARNTEHFEVIDFPFSSGLAMVRVLNNGPWESLSL